MNTNEYLAREVSKELLKKTVDNNNYPQNVKNDIKLIIDTSDTVEQMVEKLLTYFVGFNILGK